MVSYTNDVLPLFRQRDIDAMRRVRQLDLGSYADVSTHANDILDRLEIGDMPCDAAWPAENVELFRQWIANGKLP